MNSPKNYLLLLLAATTIGGALLAWRQYGELVELRAAAMNKDERADLQKRVWELEKANRDLLNRVPASREAGGADELLAAATGEDRPARDRGERGGRGDGRGRGGFEQQATAIRELMNKPEVQAMLSLQQKAGIEARYATLFKNLNLPPDQVEKLTALLAERSTTMQDVMSAARDQGINPRENPDAFRKLVADAQNEINKGIKTVIGDQGFAQLSNYEQTLPQRNVVNELQQRLSYTSSPLTAAQAEQMVQILASTAPQRTTSTAGPPLPDAGVRMGPPPGGRGGPDVGAMLGALGAGPGLGMIMDGGRGGGGGGGTAPVTPAAVAQAQSVLAPAQVAALQQIQQQQQAQQQLRQLVNDTLSAAPPGSPSSSTSTARTKGGPSSKQPRGGE